MPRWAKSIELPRCQAYLPEKTLIWAMKTRPWQGHLPAQLSYSASNKHQESPLSRHITKHTTKNPTQHATCSYATVEERSWKSEKPRYWNHITFRAVSSLKVWELSTINANAFHGIDPKNPWAMMSKKVFVDKTVHNSLRKTLPPPWSFSWTPFLRIIISRWGSTTNLWAWQPTLS